MSFTLLEIVVGFIAVAAAFKLAMILSPILLEKLGITRKSEKQKKIDYER